MKIYRVIGYDYDSSYEGHFYTRRDLAVQEAEILNRLHLQYKLKQKFEEQIDHEIYADYERIKMETNDLDAAGWEQQNLYSLVSDRWHRKYSFVYEDYDVSTEDLASMWVHVSEIEVISEFPDTIGMWNGTNTREAVANAFRWKI